MAANLQPSSTSTATWQIGRSLVDTFAISGLLREYGEQAAEDLGAFAQSDDSVEKVKEYIITGR